MTTPMQTNHTTSGRTVMSTHKYNFTDTGDWSLCSDNYDAIYFDPAQTGHDVFHLTMVGHPIGKTFTTYNHENTTTVLQALERARMIKCYAHPSIMGTGALYTEGGPVAPDAPLIEIPCTLALPPARPVGGGVVTYSIPRGKTLLGEAHLEKIFNHAMHILYTEGPRNSDGPGFSVKYDETGMNFISSSTSITIRFFYNGFPVAVQFSRVGRRSPCNLVIRPDVAFSGAPPVITRVSRKLYWEDQHEEDDGHDKEDAQPTLKRRDVDVWTDDGSFCDLARARERGWDVSSDPREVARRARVEAAVAVALAAREAAEQAAEQEAAAAREAAEHDAAAAFRRNAQAEAERVRRHEIHDALVEAERAEAAAVAARRAHQAALARAERAARPPAPYTPYRPPPGSKKGEKKAERAARRAGTREAATAAELAHGVHELPRQREIRSERFNTKQKLEHMEKLARIAHEKLSRLRRLAAEASMAREAATHVVPSLSTISDALEAALLVDDVS